jgi:hypothetical protein
MVGGVEQLAALALGECPLDLQARPVRTVFSFSVGSPRRKGLKRWMKHSALENVNQFIHTCD